MINNPIELAEYMGIKNFHNIERSWGFFQLNRNKPFNDAHLKNMLGNLSEKEKEFLMFIGLNTISTEMEKHGGIG